MRHAGARQPHPVCRETIDDSRIEIVQKSHPGKIPVTLLGTAKGLLEHVRRVNKAVQIPLGLRIQEKPCTSHCLQYAKFSTATMLR
jgi:hypothetical protein